MSDPWSSTYEASYAKNIKADVVIIRRHLDAYVDRGLGSPRTARAFCQELELILDGLSRNPETWRTHRSFFIVDLPAILAAFQVLAENPEETSGRDTLQSLLDRALTKASRVREAISSGSLDDSILSLSVLDLPQEEPKGRLSAISKRVPGKMKSFPGALMSQTGKATTGLRKRGVGLYELAGHHIEETMYDVKGALIRPVSNRLSALTETMRTATGRAFISSLIGTLLFPPLAPFLIGDALLAMPHDYTRHLARMSEEDARADLERKGRSRQEAERIMAAVKGQALRFETSCLSMSIDMIEGKATGVILCGKYLGESLEDLDRDTIVSLRDAAPDEETGQALTTWLSRIDEVA